MAEQYREAALGLVDEDRVPSLDVIDTRFHTALDNLSLPFDELRYGETETEGLWFWKRVLASVFPTFENETLKLLVRRLYRQFERERAWSVFDGVREALESLRQAQFRLGLLTNWDVRGHSLIRNLGLSPFFDEIVVSSEVGMEKPDPDIFEEMERRLGSDDARVITIGNTVEVDLRVPDGMGWETILYTPESSGTWKDEIGSWSALPDRLLG